MGKGFFSIFKLGNIDFCSINHSKVPWLSESINTIISCSKVDKLSFNDLNSNLM